MDNIKYFGVTISKDLKSRTHQYPELILSVSVNYVAGAGDAYVTSESIFCKTPPILN